MAIQWRFHLLNLEDRVAATKVRMAEMPPQVFDNLKRLIQKATAENWVELARRIPELDDK